MGDPIVDLAQSYTPFTPVPKVTLRDGPDFLTWLVASTSAGAAGVCACVCAHMDFPLSPPLLSSFNFLPPSFPPFLPLSLPLSLPPSFLLFFPPPFLPPFLPPSLPPTPQNQMCQVCPQKMSWLPTTSSTLDWTSVNGS